MAAAKYDNQISQFICQPILSQAPVSARVCSAAHCVCVAPEQLAPALVAGSTTSPRRKTWELCCGRGGSSGLADTTPATSPAS